MSDATTVARPYAKGLFEHALKADLLVHWSVILKNLAEIILHPDIERLIEEPATTMKRKSDILLQLCPPAKGVSEGKTLSNFIELLAENRRLLVLPVIYTQYEALRAEQEKTLTATVISFAALTQKEEQQLINSLSQRLKRQVTLEVHVDPSIIGGAVIHAGDLVIDGSVRGKLNKLSSNLAA